MSGAADFGVFPRVARSLLRAIALLPFRHAVQSGSPPQRISPSLLQLSGAQPSRSNACPLLPPPRLPFSFPDRFPFRAPRSFKGQVALALAVVYLVWGSTYLGMHLSLESFPPLMLGGLRNLFAGIGLFVIAVHRKAVWPSARGSAQCGDRRHVAGGFVERDDGLRHAHGRNRHGRRDGGHRAALRDDLHRAQRAQRRAGASGSRWRWDSSASCC